MALNHNQRGFIEAMKLNHDSEEDGFSILAKRDDAHLFFDDLRANALLALEKLPTPVPAEQEGSIYLPYWTGLDYLKHIAEIAAANGDVGLADRLQSLFLEYSKGATDLQRENYHTWRTIADSLASLPAAMISPELLSSVNSWLVSKYDRSLVADALGNRLLPKLIRSDVAEHHDLAFDLLAGLIGFSGDPNNSDELKTRVERYWIDEILKRNLTAFTVSEPKKTADLFRLLLQKAFAGKRGKSSWLYRPAVEANSQNYSWNTAENTTVDGLRDVLEQWIAQDKKAAGNYLVELFKSGQPIERRVAIHVFGHNFESLRPFSASFINSDTISLDLIHESYALLVQHASEFSKEEVGSLLAAIDAIQLPEEDDEDKVHTERLKQRWLSALIPAQIPLAVERYSDLEAKYGPVGENPDFLSFHTSFRGPGPSPYSQDDLLRFLLEGTLVQQLNGFVESDGWRGPSKRALCDVLEGAIKANAQDFFSARKAFLEADRGYQHAFLSGFLKSWIDDKARPKPSLDWTTAWQALLEWTLIIIERDDFWTEAVDQTVMQPNRNWLTSEIAEIVEAGTKDDAYAFDPSTLPALRRIAARLLEKLPPQPFDDVANAVNHVINTARGKAIEALINYALREARLADKALSTHSAVWAQKLLPLLQAEADRAVHGSPEFVVLFGQYMGQLMYLNAEWLAIHIKLIFQPGTTNFRLALAGLVYASVSKPVYRLLADSGIIDIGLRIDELDSGGRERLLERVGLAILWGEESLSGDRIKFLIEQKRTKDIKTIIDLYWTVRREELKIEQEELVRQFWRIFSDYAQGSPDGGDLNASLLSLTCYFEKFSKEDQARFMRLIEQSKSNDRTWFLVEEFDRLVATDPAFIGKAMLAYVNSGKPMYDFEDHLLNATRTLWKSGHGELALEITDKMRRDDGFKKLFFEIRGN